MDVAFLVTDTESPALRIPSWSQRTSSPGGSPSCGRHRKAPSLPDGADICPRRPEPRQRFAASRHQSCSPPEANLVVRSDLHQDLLRLLTVAAVEFAGPVSCEDRNHFPNTKMRTCPSVAEALTYVERIQTATPPGSLPALLDCGRGRPLPPVHSALSPDSAAVAWTQPLLYRGLHAQQVTRWYKDRPQDKVTSR